MCRKLMYVLAVLGVLACGPAAYGFVVADGLEAYLDFTKAPDVGDGNSGSVYVDKTGNANNATLSLNNRATTGAFFNASRGGPWGPAVRLNGGWVNLDAGGSMSSLASGTVEIIISSMASIDNAISVGTLFNPAWAVDDGYKNGWEVWIDRRAHLRRVFHGGRVGGLDAFSHGISGGIYPVDTAPGPEGGWRDQYVVSWDEAGNVTFMVRSYNADGAVAHDISTTTLWSAGPTASGASQFLNGMVMARIGARTNDADAWNPIDGVNEASAILEEPYHYTHVEIFRVYDRVLSVDEINQNYEEYNAEIPEPATMVILVGGTLAGLLRRRR